MVVSFSTSPFFWTASRPQQTLGKYSSVNMVKNPSLNRWKKKMPDGVLDWQDYYSLILKYINV